MNPLEHLDPLEHLAIIWAAVFFAVIAAKRTRLTPVLYFLACGAVMVNTGVLPEVSSPFIEGFSEIGIILINHGDAPFFVDRGMRIAQMVIAPVTQAMWNEVDNLSDSARGSGGFGSTGTAGATG